jgi:hypothetical protein
MALDLYPRSMGYSRVGLAFVLVALISILATGISAEDDSQHLTGDVVSDPAKAEFVYTDIENFIQAYQKVLGGDSVGATMQTDYLDRASPGLMMFIEKYDLTAERLESALAKYPEKYAAIASHRDVLESQEGEFRKAYAEIKRVIPDAVFPPTYFVVAGHRGIGSGSIEGPLISIEKDSAESIRGDLVATLVHEMVHMEQLASLGPAYFEIFNGPGKTLLALSIREGIATYFSEIITGGSPHKNEARAFLVEREADLWTRFKPMMLGSETGDFLWSDPADPEQPRDLGYAIGARIAEAYYTGASDREQAAREMMGVKDYSALLVRSGYADSLWD